MTGLIRGGVCTWTLDVADNASGRVVHELDAHLCDTSARTYATLLDFEA